MAIPFEILGAPGALIPSLSNLVGAFVDRSRSEAERRRGDRKDNEARQIRERQMGLQEARFKEQQAAQASQLEQAIIANKIKAANSAAQHKTAVAKQRAMDERDQQDQLAAQQTQLGAIAEELIGSKDEGSRAMGNDLLRGLAESLQNSLFPGQGVGAAVPKTIQANRDQEEKQRLSAEYAADPANFSDKKALRLTELIRASQNSPEQGRALQEAEQAGMDFRGAARGQQLQAEMDRPSNTLLEEAARLRSFGDPMSGERALEFEREVEQRRKPMTDVIANPLFSP